MGLALKLRTHQAPSAMAARTLLNSMLALIALGCCETGVLAQTMAPDSAQPTLAPVSVTAAGGAALADAEADAPSGGFIDAARIQARPMLRPADVLEWVPGLVVTQHSGDGKANQYFLRGFNLDHGTDFLTTVDGVPVNLPSHAHGHGYTDLNFMIPELVRGIAWRKGPYWASEGDFSSAGAAEISWMDRVDNAFGQVTLGGQGYRRLVAAASPRVADGHLLLGVEGLSNDGPWEVPQDAQRLNLLTRFSQGTPRDGFSLTATAYRGRWTATDQIPQRAIDSGLIGRFGSLDASSGGQTSRFSLSGQWRRSLHDGQLEAQVWALHYRLNLFSNFTYALDRPETGDQFEQADRRNAVGGRITRTLRHTLAGQPSLLTFGLQFRHDRIASGLYDTQARLRLDTTREDRIESTSSALYAQTQTFWTNHFRTTLGARVDHLHQQVAASLPANSGSAGTTQVSPKLTATYTPSPAIEAFAAIGRGFHSNDARGALTRVDPKTGEPALPVPVVSPSTGQEMGLRWTPSSALQVSATWWWLAIGSELVFVGDAGTTEPSRASRRRGLEAHVRWLPQPWVAVDADWSHSRARFVDDDPAGPFIPGALAGVGSLGVTVLGRDGWSGGLHARYLGKRPLVEDGSITAQPFALVDLRLSRKLDSRTTLMLDALNLTNRSAADMVYWYRSRLAGEPAAGVDGLHVHPVEPRTIRLSLRISFP